MVNESIDNVFAAIFRERVWQVLKRGVETDNRPVAEWLLIMEAELNEAKHGWIKGNGDIEALEEILQVAATAVACLQHCGVIERQFPKPFLDATNKDSALIPRYLRKEG